MNFLLLPIIECEFIFFQTLNVSGYGLTENLLYLITYIFLPSRYQYHRGSAVSFKWRVQIFILCPYSCQKLYNFLIFLKLFGKSTGAIATLHPPQRSPSALYHYFNIHVCPYSVHPSRVSKCLHVCPSFCPSILLRYFSTTLFYYFPHAGSNSRYLCIFGEKWCDMGLLCMYWYTQYRTCFASLSPYLYPITVSLGLSILK